MEGLSRQRYREGCTPDPDLGCLAIFRHLPPTDLRQTLKDPISWVCYIKGAPLWVRPSNVGAHQMKENGRKGFSPLCPSPVGVDSQTWKRVRRGLMISMKRVCLFICTIATQGASLPTCRICAAAVRSSSEPSAGAGRRPSFIIPDAATWSRFTAHATYNIVAFFCDGGGESIPGCQWAKSTGLGQWLKNWSRHIDFAKSRTTRSTTTVEQILLWPLKVGRKSQSIDLDPNPTQACKANATLCRTRPPSIHPRFDNRVDACTVRYGPVHKLITPTFCAQSKPGVVSGRESWSKDGIFVRSSNVTGLQASALFSPVTVVATVNPPRTAYPVLISG
ncbi:hypothetical protein PspLS_06621, partial [Pyricularia sp. CBS 133598]